MPNGGSDCCGTCPFNRKNRGEAGYAHARDPGPDHCDIRDLPVEDAFYTYCSNHSHHNPGRVRVPIGPVWVMGEDHYGREVWRPGPDTPEVRAEVLRLLATTPDPVEGYPAGYALVEAAILHAGDLGDVRFAPPLDRIRQSPGFAPGAEDERPTSAQNPARSAVLADRALGLILPPAAVLPFATDTVRAVAATVEQTGDPAGLAVLADALQEAGCTHAATLDYLRSPDARAPCWVVDVILGRAGG
jgi:hypothetical protein